MNAMKLMSGLSLAGVVCCAMAMPAAQAANVSGWRTDGTGTYPEATPPTQWSTSDNVVWSTPLPATGNATPVIAGNRIFVTSEPSTLVCVDKATGKVLWQQRSDVTDTMSPEEGKAIAQKLKDTEELRAQRGELANQLNRAKRVERRNPNDADNNALVKTLEAQLAEIDAKIGPVADFEMPRTHDTNGYASPTPVTDGKHVWALFGNGVASCFDMEGNRVWSRLVERPTAGWGQSSSLALADGTLVVLINKLYGLDAATGQEKWNTASNHSWASPIIVKRGDKSLIITPSGQVVEPGTGKVIADGLGRVQYNAPVPHGDVLYFIDGREGRGLTTASRLTLDEAGAAVVTKLWERELPGSRYYASPVIHDGLVYAVSREERLTVMEAADGKTVYEMTVELGGSKPNSAYPSITLAGEHLYVSSENGRTIVMAPGREHKAIAVNKHEGFRGSPVFEGTRLYLRGYKNLWCVGQ